MAEQSGGGPITREQVERLIAEAQHASGFALAQAALRILGNGWLTKCPRYVAETFDMRVTLPEAYRAALTGWRDELAAAEPVRRVARWDAGHGAYALTPPYDTPPRDIGRGDHANGRIVATPDREQAIAWGYEIEGGPIRKVARWDARRGAYVALDAHGAVCMITPDRETAIGWGYEVVDVPQPIVKQHGSARAEWIGGDYVDVWLGGLGVRAPLALLRAMLESIDAQQGGAS